jgi:hypothetical protein
MKSLKCLLGYHKIEEKKCLNCGDTFGVPKYDNPPPPPEKSVRLNIFFDEKEHAAKVERLTEAYAMLNEQLKICKELGDLSINVKVNR